MYQKKRLVSAHPILIPIWNLPNKVSVGILNKRNHQIIAWSPGLPFPKKNIYHEQPTSPPSSSTTAAILLQWPTAIQPAVWRRRRRRRQGRRQQQALQSLRERPKAEEIVPRRHGKCIANKSITMVNVYLTKRLFWVTFEAAWPSKPSALSNGELILVKIRRDKHLPNETFYCVCSFDAAGPFTTSTSSNGESGLK